MSAHESADPAGVAEGDGGQVQDDGAVALAEEAVEPGEQSFRAGGVELAGDHERGGGRRRLGDRDNEHPAVVPAQHGSKRGPLTGFQVVESTTAGVLSQRGERGPPRRQNRRSKSRRARPPPIIGMIPDDLVSAVLPRFGSGQKLRRLFRPSGDLAVGQVLVGENRLPGRGETGGLHEEARA